MSVVIVTPEQAIGCSLPNSMLSGRRSMCIEVIFLKLLVLLITTVVRAFAHGAMGRRIDPSWSGSIELFLVQASAPRLV